MNTQVAKFEAFKALHFKEQAFVIPNPWDAGSARLLSSMGFEALATSSAGYAFSAGKRDSFASLTQGEILSNAAAIAEATELPVSADLEDGFGLSPRACEDTVLKACGVGLVGGSIEDATGDPRQPIIGFSESIDRIEAAASAAKDKPFFLTARAENFLWDNPDIGDTIRRLQAYSEAGADVLYAPGLPDLAAIKEVCAELDKPVNVVMGLGGLKCTVQDLSDAGVRRISVGGSFARAAFGALKRAAAEVLTLGTFDYTADAMSGAELTDLMAHDKTTGRR